MCVCVCVVRGGAFTVPQVLFALPLTKDSVPFARYPLHYGTIDALRLHASSGRLFSAGSDGVILVSELTSLLKNKTPDSKRYEFRGDMEICLVNTHEVEVAEARVLTLEKKLQISKGGTCVRMCAWV